MKHKVIVNHWEEICEDDSCYEYGTSIIVNGKELIREASIITALKAVLEEIGADVEIEETVESEKCCDSLRKKSRLLSSFFSCYDIHRLKTTPRVGREMILVLLSFLGPNESVHLPDLIKI